MIENANLTVLVRLLSTEELRTLKQQITEELSKRHKAQEEEKCSCWACGHCFYDENAHPTYRWNKGDYKCMAYSKRGRIIFTKHKAPCWCPIKKGETK
jgi:hypothetical protein